MILVISVFYLIMMYKHIVIVIFLLEYIAFNIIFCQPNILTHNGDAAIASRTQRENMEYELENEQKTQQEKSKFPRSLCREL